MTKQRWSDGAIGKMIVLFGLLLVAAISLAIYESILEERKWQSFKVAQECNIVGKQKGTTSTGWLCNDGVTYWR